MGRSDSSTPSRRVRWIIATLVLAALLWFVPLFRVAPLKETRAATPAVAFDASAYVEEFWSGSLLTRAADAVDAEALRAALRTDPAAAAAEHGHRLGLGSSVFYLVSGRGTIVAVDDDSVSIALGEGKGTGVVIEIGPVFGNTIRDGSGLLDVSDFSNTRDFNAVSAEINRRVEEQVLSELSARSAVGTAIAFTGATEASESGPAPDILTVVPITITFP